MEFNDILRLLFKSNNENYIRVDGNNITLCLYHEWIYEEGGFIEISWDNNYEFLEQQSEETRKLIGEHLIKRHTGDAR